MVENCLFTALWAWIFGGIMKAIGLAGALAAGAALFGLPHIPPDQFPNFCAFSGLVIGLFCSIGNPLFQPIQIYVNDKCVEIKKGEKPAQKSEQAVEKKDA